MNAPRKATLRDAYERLAAREVNVTTPELESEKERLLADSESPAVASRYRFEHLYRAPEFAGTAAGGALKVLGVLLVLGGALALMAWLLGGFAA